MKLKLLSLTSSSLILIGLYWLIITFVPVAIVEAKYQVKKTLETHFHSSNPLGLIIPNLDTKFVDPNRAQDFALVIPKIYLDEPIVFNVDPNNEAAYKKALKQGIAHASGTAFPDGSGLGYYFAHSSHPDFISQYNAVFYLLGKLEAGDSIYIWYSGEKYTYQVTDKKVTSANDLSFLKTKSASSTIVLQTCWPAGTTSKRLLVFAAKI